jgi:hypothetical protein
MDITLGSVKPNRTWEDLPPSFWKSAQLFLEEKISRAMFGDEIAPEVEFLWLIADPEYWVKIAPKGDSFNLNDMNVRSIKNAFVRDVGEDAFRSMVNEHGLNESKNGYLFKFNIAGLEEYVPKSRVPRSGS